MDTLEDIQTFDDPVQVTLTLTKGVIRGLKNKMMKDKYSPSLDRIIDGILADSLDTVSMITYCIGHGEEWGANRAGDKPELSRYVLLVEPWLERFKLHGKEEVREAGAPIPITLGPNEWNKLIQPVEGDMIILSLRHVSK